jgi:hypothetical protein
MVNAFKNNIRLHTRMLQGPIQSTYMVHLVLHPHGIAPTFLKLDSWSPGAGFIPIISTKENCKKEVKFYAYKKI